MTGIKSRIAGLVLAALAALIAAAGPALAHSKMSGSTPAKGETVAAGLDALDLRFDRKVRLTRVDLDRAPEGTDLDALAARLGEDDKPVELDGQTAVELTGNLPKGFVDTATLRFEPLPPGVYWLYWIAIAQDGHVMTGDVPFAVTAAD